MGFTRCRCDELVFLILTFVGLLPHDRTTRRPRRHALARRLTFKGTESLAQGVTEVYQVPVFLQFHHQREAEALEEAAPVIARKVALLVDGYLGGLP